MTRFIPREKMGKKARHALDAKRRRTWVVPPVTRTIESRKKYSRKRIPMKEKHSSWSFCFWGLLCMKRQYLFRIRSGYTEAPSSRSNPNCQIDKPCPGQYNEDD